MDCCIYTHLAAHSNREIQIASRKRLRSATCPNAMDFMDGHRQCPACHVMDHLREALIDPCPECSIMPFAMHHARLAGLESASDSWLLSSNITTTDRKRKQTSQSEKKNKKTKYFDSARKVDQLSSPIELLLPLLAKADVREKVQPELCMTSSPTMHTGHDLDVMSVAATDSLFQTITDVNLGAEENLPADLSKHSGSVWDLGPCLRSQVGHLQLLHPWKER